MAVWCALDIVAPALDLPGQGSRLVEQLQDVLHPHNEPAQVFYEGNMNYEIDPVFTPLLGSHSHGPLCMIQSEMNTKLSIIAWT